MFRNVALLFVFIALGFYKLNGQELWNNLMFREYEVGFKVKNAKPLRGSFPPVVQKRVHVYYDKFDKQTTFTSKEILFNPHFELKASKKDRASKILYTIWVTITHTYGHLFMIQ